MEAVVFCLLILNEKYSLETVSKAKRRELKIYIPILSIAPNPPPRRTSSKGGCEIV